MIERKHSLTRICLGVEAGRIDLLDTSDCQASTSSTWRWKLEEDGLSQNVQVPFNLNEHWSLALPKVFLSRNDVNRFDVKTLLVVFREYLSFEPNSRMRRDGKWYDCFQIFLSRLDNKFPILRSFYFVGISPFFSTLGCIYCSLLSPLVFPSVDGGI